MNDLGWILLGAGVGGAAGVFYFGLLYATIRRLKSAGQPQLMALGSFAGRLAVTIVALFLLVRGGHWERGLAFLAGFVVVRLLLVRRWRPRQPGNSIEAGPKRAVGDAESDRVEPGNDRSPVKHKPGEKRFEGRRAWK